MHFVFLTTFLYRGSTLNNYKFLEMRVDKLGKKIMTQDELAEKLNITRNRIQQLETSPAVIPKDYELKAYCEYFNTTSDYLLDLRSTKPVDENIAMINKITGLDENAINTLKNCTPFYHSIINKLLSSNAIDKLVCAYIYSKSYLFQDIQVADKVIGLTTLSEQENINYHKYQSVEFLKELLEILNNDYELFEKLCDNHKLEAWKRVIDIGIEAMGEKANIDNFLTNDNVPNEIKEYAKSKVKKGE